MKYCDDCAFKGCRLPAVRYCVVCGDNFCTEHARKHDIMWPNDKTAEIKQNDTKETLSNLQ